MLGRKKARKEAIEQYGLTEDEAKVFTVALSGIYAIYIGEGSVRPRIEAAGGKQGYKEATRQLIAHTIIGHREHRLPKGEEIAKEAAGWSADEIGGG